MKRSSANEENVPAKKCRPSLSLKKKKRADKSERFSFVTDEEIARGCEGVIPANTKLSNQWAVRNLTEWMDSRASARTLAFEWKSRCCVWVAV